MRLISAGFYWDMMGELCATHFWKKESQKVRLEQKYILPSIIFFPYVNNFREHKTQADNMCHRATKTSLLSTIFFK